MCLDSSSSSYIRLWVIDIEEADFCDYVTEPFALFPLAADLREFCYAPDFIFYYIVYYFLRFKYIYLI